MDRTLWRASILVGQKKKITWSLSFRQGKGELVAEEVWKEGTLTPWPKEDVIFRCKKKKVPIWPGCKEKTTGRRRHKADHVRKSLFQDLYTWQQAKEVGSNSGGRMREDRDQGWGAGGWTGSCMSREVGLWHSGSLNGRMRKKFRRMMDCAEPVLGISGGYGRELGILKIGERFDGFW